MKKAVFILAALCSVLFFAGFEDGEKNEAKPVYIPPDEQRQGDSAQGYRYLTTGDFLKSGFPFDFFQFTHPRGDNYLGREGKNAWVDQGFNVITNADSMDVVIPTCLQCHAQVFEGKLVLGLGNASIDFTNISQQSKKLALLKMWKSGAPKKYRAVKPLLQSILTVNPLMETEVRGVNAADRLAALLVAHRDPKTLQWSDTALLDIPAAVVPTDVPAWWLMKKKNAMFYTGFGRGDFSRFLMMSNLLTVKDTSEAGEVYAHFGDVLAYIKKLNPPAYPKAIDKVLAGRGEKVFDENCRKCHGSYGENWTYPNLLVPGSIVKTDSMLYQSNQQAQQFIDWFNKSWFAQGDKPARLAASNGYVAPPLDGVWVTAPYLHNGSVPTIEGVLNSSIRPTYWSRDFENPDYDYSALGWKYDSTRSQGNKKVYNTTLPGYGNYGHYFGDKLSIEERRSVIEYLKTL